MHSAYTTEIDPNAIAVIGMAGRFPGANTIEAFWHNLCAGVESITFFSPDDLIAAGIPPEVANHPDYVKAGAVLSEIDGFDAAFFGFNSREAEIMDPQHRIFLETAWHALEHAGYDPQRYGGAIGMYAGAGMNTYLLNNLVPSRSMIETVGALQAKLGNDKDFLATRVSYKLNLRGPSLSVQTGCSTSLVAVHLACQSLLSGESDMTLAGGVAVNVPQGAGTWYQEGGIVSPDGHCRAFDARALGAIGGNGVGVVVLKRLQDALDDGDTIHALIKGSAVNNDGAAKVGYTAPAIQGQANVIAEAQTLAGVDPETITYIEAHGTGTPLGDPIEMAALTKVFRSNTQQSQFCAIGSVKTNIGHLDAAAGVAGLIKTVLALKHGQIPASLHFETPNPQIDFANSPFYVNTELTSWHSDEPRRAGVSSFGIGGTNAHVILEEAPAPRPGSESRTWQLLPLSAKTATALDTLSSNLAAHLTATPDLSLADVAYTLQLGRQQFSHRRMVICRDLDDAASTLATNDPQRVLTAVQPAASRAVVFMCSGQGAQYPQMGAELYAGEPIFREQVDRCAEILRPQLGLDIRSLIFPDDAAQAEAHRRLEQTQYAQPALFVIEYALAQLWIAWGLKPEAMIGHSVGEFVAACLASVLTLEDALALIATRGRLMQELAPGAMLSVPLPEAELQALLLADGTQRLAIAAVNTPSLCVVAGPEPAIRQLEQRLAERGLETRRLHTSHAFHSPMMEPMLDAFAAQVARTRLSPPQIPYISNVTGTWITPAEATDPAYWVRHVRETVRFAAGVQELLNDPQRVFVEIGPGTTLSTLVRQQSSEQPRLIVSSLRRPQEQAADLPYLLRALGQLWLAGVTIDWQALHAGSDGIEQRQRVPLPGYPFERQRYWIDPLPTELTERPSSGSQIKTDLADWFATPAWKLTTPLRAAAFEAHAEPWLIFSDPQGVGEQLAQRLTGAGQTVITVQIGEEFAQITSRQFTINPAQRDDYDRLIATLRDEGLSPGTIVHCWSLAQLLVTEQHPERFKQAQTTGYTSLVLLGQALDAAQLLSSLRLTVVTAAALPVTAAEAVRVEQTTLLGPCLTIAQEYPQIRCCCVDIGAPVGTAQMSRVVDYLIGECQQGGDPIIAYRGQQRWVQTFEPLRLDESRAPLRELRQQGVYLISGGLGNIGLQLAAHLARRVQARLVLVGRTPLPDREQWPAYLESAAANDRAAAAMRQVLDLEQLGAEILVLSADVSDAAEMQAVIERTVERFGALHGVIHCAGITAEADTFRFIAELQAADALTHFRPKVYGAYTLAQVVADRQLDFVLLFSSNAAILGGLGLTAYAAANRFLNAFAAQQSQASLTPWISTTWDGWAKPTAAGQATERHTSIDRYTLVDEEGVQAVEQIVRYADSAEVFVSKGNLGERLLLWSNRSTAQAEQAGGLPAPTTHPRPPLSTAYVAPRDEIEEEIAGIWQRVLGVAPIGCYDNFFELGGHSLVATQVLSHVREAYQVDLPIRQLLESPTIADLAIAVVQQNAQHVDEAALAQLLDQLESVED